MLRAGSKNSNMRPLILLITLWFIFLAPSRFLVVAALLRGEDGEEVEDQFPSGEDVSGAGHPRPRRRRLRRRPGAGHPRRSGAGADLPRGTSRGRGTRRDPVPSDEGSSGEAEGFLRGAPPSDESSSGGRADTERQSFGGSSSTRAGRSLADLLPPGGRLADLHSFGGSTGRGSSTGAPGRSLGPPFPAWTENEVRRSVPAQHQASRQFGDGPVFRTAANLYDYYVVNGALNRRSAAAGREQAPREQTGGGATTTADINYMLGARGRHKGAFFGSLMFCRNAGVQPTTRGGADRVSLLSPLHRSGVEGSSSSDSSDLVQQSHVNEGGATAGAGASSSSGLRFGRRQARFSALMPSSSLGFDESWSTDGRRQL